MCAVAGFVVLSVLQNVVACQDSQKHLNAMDLRFLVEQLLCFIA